MSAKAWINRIIEASVYTIQRLPASSVHDRDEIYAYDGLHCIHNPEFMNGPAIRNAYKRG